MAYNFTIIIPHKNTPQLLRKCLDSIPKRDDIQIVVVDDNSDPDVVDFTGFPGMGEDRIEVYLTKEGKGAGYARNIGLEQVQGKWVVFADSDDYFTEDFESILDTINLDNESDIVFFKGKSEHPDGSKAYRADGYNQRVDVALKTVDFIPLLLYSSPWNKAINMSILKHKIHFNEVRWGNDVVFMAKVAFWANHYKAIDKIGYCILDGSNSLVKQISIESLQCRLEQDLEGLPYYLSKYKIRSEDKHWYFVTWYNLYRKSKKQAIKYAFSMVQGIGFFAFFKELCKAQRKLSC